MLGVSDGGPLGLLLRLALHIELGLLILIGYSLGEAIRLELRLACTNTCKQFDAHMNKALQFDAHTHSVDDHTTYSYHITLTHTQS